MKLFRIIMGVLCLIGASVCMAFPFATQITYGYVISAFVGVIGALLIVDYLANHKRRKAAGVDAAAGITALLLGILGLLFFVCNLTLPGFTYTVQELIAIGLAISVIAEGVLTVIAAFTRNFKKLWVRILLAAMGTISVFGGIFGLIFIPVVIALMGMFTAVGMAFTGIDLVVSGCMDEEKASA